MAKFNVTVDFDWMDDAGVLDDEIKDKVVSSVAEKVKEKIFGQIESECTKACEKALDNINCQIDDRINAMMDEFFSVSRDITDEFGYVVRKNVSVREIMKGKCHDFMLENVDDQGRTGTYSAKRTRAEYMVNKIVNDEMKKTIDTTINDVVIEAKAKIKEQVKERLGAEVGKLINLEQLMK